MLIPKRLNSLCRTNNPVFNILINLFCKSPDFTQKTQSRNAIIDMQGADFAPKRHQFFGGLVDVF